MDVFELKTGSLSEFFGTIESQPGGLRVLFRGQGNSAWGLTPSLFRQQSINISADSLEQAYGFYEQQAIEQFFDEGLPYLPPISRGYSNDRILAQHFGVPTSFLDWTQDPLVALFFATESWEADTDAALFAISPDAHFKREQVKSTGSAQVIALRPPAIDRRIPAQKSVFTFHPYGPSDEHFVPLDKRPDIGGQYANPAGAGGTKRGFYKVIIPKRLKRGLHNALFNMGIDRRNLFPGLDGVGMEISSRARNGHLF